MSEARKPYLLASGDRVPSVTTVLGRFKDAGPLMWWAWKEGTEGRDYRATRDAAADAGTLAHKAVEMWIAGRVPTFPPTDVGTKAQTAFEAFLEWADQSNLSVTETEVRMVSERYGFGGTMDALMIGGKRSVGDWKSSNGLYAEYLIQIAAYGKLWEENRPDEPITGGYHLLRFDKIYGDFTHRWWGALDEAWEAFLLMRRLYDIDKTLRQRVK